jgi:hypothetical protein
VAGTLGYAAELWKVSEAEALSVVSDNFATLFGVPP